MRTRVLLAATAAFVLPAVCSFGQVRPGGSYLMYDRNQSPVAFGNELDQMSAVGMNIVTPISLGHLNGAPGTAGGPCTALAADGLMYPSSLVANPPTDDKLGTLLSLADARGMKVMLGTLQTFGDWTTGAEFNSLNSCNDAVIAEVDTLYGQHPSLMGFSLTQEVWLNWVKYYGPSYYAIGLLQHLVNTVHAVNPNLVVLAAPVFKEYGTGAMPGLTAADTQVAMGQFLSGSGLKLVAPQDGQGALAGAPSLGELPSYYSAMESAAQSNGAELWSTVETFVNNGGNQNQYPAAPISRITQQIVAEQPYVTGMLTWMFGHDMSYQATYYPVASSQLYMDYQAYYTGVPRLQKLPFTYQYGWIWNAIGVPSQSYPDTQLTQLTDGQGGGFPYTVTDWTGFSDAQDENSAAITINLGGLKNIQKVRVLAMTQTNSGIALPASGVVLSSLGNLEQVVDQTTGILAVSAPNFPNTVNFSFGWIEFSPATGTSFNQSFVNAQYLLVSFYHVGWLFVSEVEVY